jgi:hypothetical protein
MNAKENIEAQERKKVLRGQQTANYYVDVKVTDKAAKEYIKSFADKKIPLPVSPQLVYPRARADNPDSAIAIVMFRDYSVFVFRILVFFYVYIISIVHIFTVIIISNVT